MDRLRFFSVTVMAIAFLAIIANISSAAIFGSGTPEQPMVFYEDYEGSNGNAPGEGVNGSNARMWIAEYALSPTFEFNTPGGKAGTFYRLEVWLKTNLENPSKAGVLISWVKSDGTRSSTNDLAWNFVLTDQYKILKGDFDTVYMIPEDHTSVRFQLYNTTKAGIIYADEAYVEVIYPGPPQNLVATRNNIGSITLNWEKAQIPNFRYRIYQGARPPEIQEYNIYCSETPTLTRDSQKIGSLAHDDEQENYTWSSESESFGTAFSERLRGYYFVVTAVDSHGKESVVSNEVSVGPVIPGSISGIVRENDTMTGIQDALVVLKTNEDVSFYKDCRTDDEGNFSFSDLPLGNYFLTAQKDRYELSSRQAIYITQDVLNPEGIIYLEKDETPTDAPRDLAGEIPVPGIIRLTWLAPGILEKEEDSKEEAISFKVYRAQRPFDKEDLTSSDVICFEFKPPVDNVTIPRGMEVEWLDDMDQEIVLGADYYYRVSALDLASNESSLSELLGPINSESLLVPRLENYLLGEAITGPVELIWSFENEGATKITYLVEYADSDCFDEEGTLYVEESNTQNFKIDNLSELPAKSLWFWRVKAVCEWQGLWDRAFSYSDYSAPGSFFVVEQGEQNGLQYIKLFPTYVTKEESVKLNFVLNTESKLKVTVYDTRGNMVKVIVDGEVFEAGSNELLWNLENQKGLQVKNGLYLVHFVSEGINSTHNVVVFK